MTETVIERVEFTGVLKTIYDHIEATNAAYAAMTPAQKRVQTAKDVLLQLELKRMRGCSTYFTAESVDRKINEVSSTMMYGEATPDADLELRNLFKQMPECTVCGIGALFVAMVEREDELTVGEAASRGIYNRSLQEQYMVERRKVFTSSQLDYVEKAFEAHPGFCPRDEHPDLRLGRVMLRIIEVEGDIDFDTFPRTYANT